MFSLVLLALTQSLTEFLPISSSGHLILLEKFGLSDQTLVMDVGLHVGTLLAVIAYFWRDIQNMLAGLFGKKSSRLLWQVVVATLPVLFFGAFLSRYIETVFRSAGVVAVTSIFFGLLLWGIDKRSGRDRGLEKMSYADAFLIGLAQVLALVPGTSRSGITITCARALGLKRSDSTRFSMLLSIPTISLAALWVFARALYRGREHDLLQWELLWGIGLAAVFGFLVIWLLMRWVQKASFAVFGIYRVVLGLVLIGLLSAGFL